MGYPLSVLHDRLAALGCRLRLESGAQSTPLGPIELMLTRPPVVWSTPPALGWAARIVKVEWAEGATRLWVAREADRIDPSGQEDPKCSAPES